MTRLTIVVAVLLSVTVARSADARQVPAGKTIAITFDDLPYVGAGGLAGAQAATTGILDALRRHEVPAAGFVTGSRAWVEGEVDSRVALLREWIRAGATLENHSFTHLPFNDTPPQQYRDDAVLGHMLPSRLMAEVDSTTTWYRHPFNQVGPTTEEALDFAAFMARRGQRIAPFTVEHADYVFERVYEEAVGAGDTALAERIGRAYLDHLDTAMEFAERAAGETFGRPIPHILLIHANDINGRYTGEMLSRLAARGYTFVSLDVAVSDPAYRTEAAHTTWGRSWLHRWRAALGLPPLLRDEPDPPSWIMQAYEAAPGRR